MGAESFHQNRAFFAPAFRIELDGRTVGRQVIADVLEVSFTDDVDNIDSFEFVLHDWDSVLRSPKYSSPWDEKGEIRKLSPDGPNVPVFEPGASVDLFLGYTEEGDLPLIMKGEVVSLTPSFPASGAPTCRVRALDAFQRMMQKVHVEKNYAGTAKDVIEKLCSENNIPLKMSPIAEPGKPQEKVEVEGILYEEIEKRAKQYKLSMMTISVEGKPTLFLSAPTEGGDEPVAEFAWGRTLISFAPVLSAKGQVAEVVVRAGDPKNKKNDGRIEVKRTWEDVKLSPTALGPAGKTDLNTIARGLREVIKPAEVTTEEGAKAAGDAHLRDLARTLITGNGSSIGLPTLRAGKLVALKGLGVRFDGKWRLTQTTHSIGAGGYTTTFQARKEVLDA
jgi:phage protein D